MFACLRNARTIDLTAYSPLLHFCLPAQRTPDWGVGFGTALLSSRYNHLIGQLFRTHITHIIAPLR